MLVLRTSNFQGATIRPIVPRRKHSIVFISSGDYASFGSSDDFTILLFHQIITRKIWALRKTLLLGSIVQFLGLSKSHYKPSLSNFPCVRVVNVWQRESIKSVSF